MSSIKELNAVSQELVRLQQGVEQHRKEIDNKQKVISTIRQVSSASGEEFKPVPKGWRYVHNPTESERYPLVKDDPAQIALKKLNIIR